MSQLRVQCNGLDRSEVSGVRNAVRSLMKIVVGIAMAAICLGLGWLCLAPERQVKQSFDITDDHNISFERGEGYILIHVHWLVPAEDGLRLMREGVGDKPGWTYHRLLPLGFLIASRGTKYLWFFQIGAPRWALVVVSALSGCTAAYVFLASPIRSFVRQRRGQCLKCGYNLTGLTEPRCPECGNKW